MAKRQTKEERAKERFAWGPGDLETVEEPDGELVPPPHTDVEERELTDEEIDALFGAGDDDEDEEE